MASSSVFVENLFFGLWQHSWGYNDQRINSTGKELPLFSGDNKDLQKSTLDFLCESMYHRHPYNHLEIGTLTESRMVWVLASKAQKVHPCYCGDCIRGVLLIMQRFDDSVTSYYCVSESNYQVKLNDEDLTTEQKTMIETAMNDHGDRILGYLDYVDNA